MRELFLSYEGGIRVKKIMLLLLPVLLMSLLYINMPEMVQILSTNSAFQEVSNTVAPSEAQGGPAADVQAAQGEISVEAFPKRKTDKDDTERIQRAVDYCLENNKDLVIPFAAGSHVAASGYRGWAKDRRLRCHGNFGRLPAESDSDVHDPEPEMGIG